jgi:exodeoxyribonuclease VII small subunit
VTQARNDTPEPKELDFEACIERLDQIVHELESGQVQLDKAIALFEEGLQLGNRCSALLDRAEMRVDRLLERQNGGAQDEPFDSTGA